MRTGDTSRTERFRAAMLLVPRQLPHRYVGETSVEEKRGKCHALRRQKRARRIDEALSEMLIEAVGSTPRD